MADLWLTRAEAVKLTADRAETLPPEGRHMPVTGPEDMLAGMLAARTKTSPSAPSARTASTPNSSARSA